MLRYIVFLLLSLTDALIEYHEDVTWELQTSNPPTCQHYPSKAELQGHVDSIYGLGIGEVTSGAPDLSVSESECEVYASASSLTWGDVLDTGVADPQGCYHNGNAIYYNTNTGSTKECVNPYTCIQKVSAKPVRTISDAALPHGALYRPLYYEQTSGSPDLSMSQAECEAYFEGIGQTMTNSNLDSDSRPSGCIKVSTNNFFNIASSAYECNDSGGSNSGICIQKNSLYYEKSSGSPDLSVSESECLEYAKSLGRDTITPGDNGAQFPKGCYHWDNGMSPPSFYFGKGSESGNCGHTYNTHIMRCVEKDIPFVFNVPPTLEEVASGTPLSSSDPRYVSESECEAYAGTIGATCSTFDNSVYPYGCISMSNNRVQWVSSGGGDCNVKTSTGNCIQKSPTLDAYVSESECEQYAVNTDGVNWGGQTDLTSRPFGCYLRLGDTYYNKNSLSTTPCSSSEICIQKAPFHAKSVQSIVKQAIDAILDAEMHYAESVNVFIEDFDHPKTTASDTLYTKQASYAVTDYDFTYSTITANEEWRPAIPFNTLEEAKASCSADSSNCLGVTHRHLGGVDLYLRHNGNSDLQLASYDQEHDERLYFQLLVRPFFIRFPILASTVGNDLKALCASYPSCFARGNYVYE